MYKIIRELKNDTKKEEKLDQWCDKESGSFDASSQAKGNDGGTILRPAKKQAERNQSSQMCFTKNSNGVQEIRPPDTNCLYTLAVAMQSDKES